MSERQFRRRFVEDVGRVTAGLCLGAVSACGRQGARDTLDSGLDPAIVREISAQIPALLKTFAYAVMQLVQEGHLDLDVPLATYVPDRWIADDAQFLRITARHVLSHRTGLPNWRSQEDPLRVAFEPGLRFQYSGEGYSYLQSGGGASTRSWVVQA